MVEKNVNKIAKAKKISLIDEHIDTMVNMFFLLAHLKLCIISFQSTVTDLFFVVVLNWYCMTKNY